MFENRVISETPAASAVIRPTRLSRRYLPTGTDETNRVFRSIDDSKFVIPTIDTRLRYGDLYMRHPKDRIHIKPYDGWDDKPYKPEIPQFISREPSFTTFKVPFEMVCKERYNNFIKKYEDQFGHEIRSLIDNQPTAREATYLVRIMAYTTLWPPYHNKSELNQTSHNFYRLTPKENARFMYIMTHDFS